LGEGSLQEEKWNDMEVKIPIRSATQAEGDSSIAGISSTASDGHCEYTFSIYPSSDLHNLWNSKLAWVIPWCVAGTFLILALTFFMYDRFVRRRNEKVVNAAARSTKLVSSLFPSTVRDRLLAEQEHAEQREQGTKSRLKNFLAGDGSAACDLEETDDIMYKTKPIADLFPETTILFGDIAG
jgi:cytoskeletal protein RodZ